jgi:hypothetical protein
LVQCGRPKRAAQRADLPPRVQLWCWSALDWAIHLEPIRHVEKQTL